MLTGPMTAAPGREQSGALAVVDNSFRPARLPTRCSDRGPLVMSSLWGGPHLFPRVDVATVLPRRARNTGVAAFPSEALGGGTRGASLLSGAAVLFGFNRITAREAVNQPRRDLSYRLPCVALRHAHKHGETHVRFVGNFCQTNGETYERGV